MTERGFTLVEVLVALLIFGMIAAGGVAMLSFSVRAQAATSEKFDDLAALNRTLSVLSADLAQAVDRPARDERGVRRPAFTGEAGPSDPMLRVVRSGWTNLDDAGRPTLQKVAYRVANGALERIAYPQVDGAPPLTPALLLDGVTDLRLRYRYRGAWSDRWDGANGAALPDAIELTVTRTDQRQYRQLFLVGTGYAPPPGFSDALRT
ncbi:type II secretion system minor pseudopilin GspJ [Sphingomonas lenta]|uniref:Type II secretion system protein J n=1 Tax=Sphingomonas lenta TaxID=1141887 RepID=A0A2A2SKY9_9SPHN|nr:type II secretion system minor pseudopilin GspJ [Sphingomonas lenta]PAX09681.1 type II secretion system protein GspJ [Sphingomonas lenta]